MDSNVVILSFGLSLLNQTFTHHPSLLSLLAGPFRVFHIGSISVVASGLKRNIQE